MPDWIPIVLAAVLVPLVGWAVGLLLRIKEFMERHEHTLYGPGGQNGLRGDVRELRDNLGETRGELGALTVRVDGLERREEMA